MEPIMDNEKETKTPSNLEMLIAKQNEFIAGLLVRVSVLEELVLENGVASRKDFFEKTTVKAKLMTKQIQDALKKDEVVSDSSSEVLASRNDDA
jgi:hypothetical protein